jgi:hypothetical protein
LALRCREREPSTSSAFGPLQSFQSFKMALHDPLLENS